MARNYDGGAALAYLDPSSGPKVAVAAPMQAFGAPEDVPVPPPVGSDQHDSSIRLWSPDVAHARDGRTLVVYGEIDYRTSVHRAIAVVRSPDGRWSAPQVIGDAASSFSAAASGSRLMVLWSERAPGEPRTAPRRIWVAEAQPGGTFSPRQAISPQGVAVHSTFGPFGMVASNRGDLLVHFNGGAPDQTFATDVFVVEQPLGAVWGRPLPVATGMGPSAAVGDRADAILVWSTPAGIGASYRPPLGAWGREETAEVPGAIGTSPVAIDSTGTAIALRADPIVRRLVAVLRPADGRFGEPIDVVAPGTDAGAPAIATDPYGNGLIAWSTRDSVGVRPYSAHPPTIGRPGVGPANLTVRLDEPAQLAVTVVRQPIQASASRKRKVAFKAPGRSGRNRLALPRRARAQLARRGRFRVTVRAHDGGPRASKRTVRFRRR